MALISLCGVGALAIGVISLRHPIVGWAYGQARKSDAPPVWDVGLLLVPVVLLGIVARRAWWSVAVSREVRRERRRRARNDGDARGSQ